MDRQRDFGLYVHVPFCTRKCPYCHFYVQKNSNSEHDDFLAALCAEWEQYRSVTSDHKLVSLYLGGGTPSLLSPDHIAKIIRWFNPSSDVEITLEANPENITEERMRAYRDAGVNRVSIGVQTLDSTLLTQLKRTHCAEQAIKAIHTTSKAGISNISIDLMLELPGQTLEMVERTFRQAAVLPITHLSLYNLVLEPPSAFYSQRNKISKQMPDDDTAVQMLHTAIDQLSAQGFSRYEISAFERGDHPSRHNVGYWTARPFLGLGPSAFSYWDNRRFRNVADLKAYSRCVQKGQSAVDFEEELSAEARRRELLAVELRLLRGVALTDFQSRHGALSPDTTKTLGKLSEDGLLVNAGPVIRLTERGRLCYDLVASEVI